MAHDRGPFGPVEAERRSPTVMEARIGADSRRCMLEATSMSDLRRWAIPIGIAAALLLAYLYNPWVNPDGTLATIVTWAFWILSIALVVILFQLRNDPEATNVEIEGPAFARFLFNNSRAGLFWLPI